MRYTLRVLHRLPYFLASIYWKIAKPRTLGVRVIVSHKKQILLVQHTYLPDYYFPGGGVKLHESLQEAAKREVKEETGIAIKQLIFLGVYQYFNEGKQDVVAVFCAKPVNYETKLVRETREIRDVNWYMESALPCLSDTTIEFYNDYKSGKTSPHVRVVE